MALDIMDDQKVLVFREGSNVFEGFWGGSAPRNMTGTSTCWPTSRMPTSSSSRAEPGAAGGFRFGNPPFFMPWGADACHGHHTKRRTRL